MAVSQLRKPFCFLENKGGRKEEVVKEREKKQKKGEKLKILKRKGSKKRGNVIIVM